MNELIPEQVKFEDITIEYKKMRIYSNVDFSAAEAESTVERFCKRYSIEYFRIELLRLDAREFSFKLIE